MATHSVEIDILRDSSIHKDNIVHRYEQIHRAMLNLDMNRS